MEIGSSRLVGVKSSRCPSLMLILLLPNRLLALEVLKLEVLKPKLDSEAPSEASKSVSCMQISERRKDGGINKPDFLALPTITPTTAPATISKA